MKMKLLLAMIEKHFDGSGDGRLTCDRFRNESTVPRVWETCILQWILLLFPIYCVSWAFYYIVLAP